MSSIGYAQTVEVTESTYESHLTNATKEYKFVRRNTGGTSTIYFLKRNGTPPDGMLLNNGDLGYFSSEALTGYGGISWSNSGNYSVLTINWSSLDLGNFFGTDYKSRRIKIGVLETIECIDGSWTSLDDPFGGDSFWSCQQGLTPKPTQPRDEVDYYLTIVDPRLATLPNIGDICLSSGGGHDFTRGGLADPEYDAGDAWSIQFESGYTTSKDSDCQLSTDCYTINRSGASAGDINARLVWNFQSSEFDNISTDWSYDFPIDGTYQKVGSFLALPSVNAGVNESVCENTGNYTLTGSPSGGTWSGDYISSSGSFNTNTAPVGNHTVYYEITDGNGCRNTDSKTIQVESEPSVSASNYSFCENDGIKSLSGSPSGGTWTGTSVSSNGDFDTDIAPGNYSLTYSYTNGNGCTSTATSVVTVNGLPSVSAGSNQSACINDGSIALTGASPNGGSWSGSNVSGSTFNVASAGVGTHSVTYTYTNSNGCTSSDTKNIVIHDITSVDAGGEQEFCINTGLRDLNFVTPSGGTWSGNGVTGDQFDTSIGSGNYTVTYTYTNANGCTSSDSKTVRINNEPSVNAGSNIAICINDGRINLSGSPFNGNWSGDGVFGNQFDPATAGPGTHTLTYSYTNSDGCSNSDTKTVTVNSPTSLNIGGSLQLCRNGGVYNLNDDLVGDISGGTWSGSGVSGSNFDPVSAGIGSHYITYEYTNSDGCTSVRGKNIDVLEGPQVTAGPNVEVCLQEGSFVLSGESPSGGSWSGFGISGASFDPSITGTGIFEVTYSYDDGSCVTSDTRSITVNDVDNISAGRDLVVCVNDDAFLLTGASKSGGLWNGDGVSGNFFDPATAGVGEHTITYDYTSGEGCSASASRKITVQDIPSVNAGADIVLCSNQGNYNLSDDVNIVGGSFSGNGVNGLNFNPSSAGVGSHQITYTYTDPVTECSNSDFRIINVIDPDPVSVGSDIQVCIDQGIIDISGTESVTGGIWSGNGVTGTMFDPATAGIGEHILTYTVVDVNGCNSVDTKMVTVNELPVVSAGSDIFVCSGSPLVTLGDNARPIGGTWSGDYVNGNNFDVSLSGGGTFEVTYTYTDPQGCTNSDTKSVIVNSGAVVDAGNDFQVCESESSIDLASRVVPAGGSFSGIGVSGNNFSPSSVGPGSYSVTYSVSNAYGCTGSDDFLITVNPSPNVDAGSDFSICLNEPVRDLMPSAFPTGGSFQGNGVVAGNSFDPSVAGIGDHVIRYLYTDINGCSNIDSRTITVTDLPDVDAGGNTFMCIGQGLIDLDEGAEPSNGTWSGSGVSFDVFDPSVAGVGTHVITYSIVQGNGCTNSDQKIITVLPNENVNAGSDISVCLNQGLVDLNNGVDKLGGTWSGTGVNGSSFDPSTAGIGNYTVTYNYTSQYGCSAVDSKVISVIRPESVSVGSDIEVCVTAPSFDIYSNAFPSGGIFTGSGIVGNDFDPALAGVGSHDLTYTVVDGNGCTVSESRIINVVEPTSVDAGDNIVTCISRGLIDLDENASITGGTWSGNGVEGNFFNTASAGIGSHTVNYVYNHGNNCVASDNVSITVREDITVDAGNDLSFCLNDNVFDLSGESDKSGGVWTGNGVNGSNFSPNAAGVGIHQLTYTYTDAFSCVAEDYKTVTVYDVPTVNAGGDLEICSTAGAMNLSSSAFPTGGTWSGPGVSGNFIDPAQLALGSYTITYTVTNENGCVEKDFRTVEIVQPETVDVGSNEIVCVNNGIIDLDNIVNQGGGTWTGTGVSNNIFDPAFAGIGTHVLDYTYNNGLGCISTASKVYTVKEEPSVNIGLDLQVCLNEIPFDLNNDVDKQGGIWSGNGLSGSIFDPGDAGVGVHNVTYTYTDINNCSISETKSIEVINLPILDAGPPATICNTAPPLNLSNSVSISGGTWKGTAVNGSEFDPSNVGIGSYEVTYTITTINGCKVSDNKTINVVEPEPVTIGANQILCINSQPIDLDLEASILGGIWSGSGLDGSYFVPDKAGIGNHQLTYTYDDGSGCVSTATKTIQVRSALEVDAGDNFSICINANNYNLLGDVNIVGGEWSGSGVSGNTFRPASAGVGAHVLEYTVINEFGCTDSDTRTVVVTESNNVSAGSDMTVCIDNGIIDLTNQGFPLGGVWSGQGVDSTSFSPSFVGEGNYELTYSYDDGSGCIGSDSKTIVVESPAAIDAGSNFDLCINADPIDLVAVTPEEGSWSGNGVIANQFDPLSAGIGSHVLTYESIDNNSCFSIDSIEVNVIPEPTLTIGEDSSVCLNDNPISLIDDVNIRGGSFSGNGVTGNIFNPSEAGSGTHVITYTLRFNGCSIVSFRNIEVNEPQPVNIGESLDMCLASDSYDLIQDVDIVGGNFTGAGVSGTVFNPEDAGIGSHVITYTYTNAFGCTSDDFRVINVQEELAINAGNDFTVCSNVGTYDLTQLGTPSGGLYVGEGVANNVFDPQSVEPGSYEIEYVYNFSQNCVSTDILEITVLENADVEVGNDTILCVNNGAMDLSLQGELTGLWSGTGVVSNVFYPELAEIGVHELYYTDNNSECDIAGIRRITVVGLPDKPSLVNSSVNACVGDFVKLSATANSEDNNVTVDWFHSPEDTEPFDSGNEINYEVKEEERVYAKVRNAFGCYSINSEYVQILTESPSAVMEVSDNDINFGLPVQFFANQAVNVESYRWDFGDGLYSTRKNPFHYYYEADTFNVSLEMVSANGCKITMTKEDMIIVRPEANSIGEDVILSGEVYEALKNGKYENQIIGTYPNPVGNSSMLNVRALIENAGTFDIYIYSIEGKSRKIGSKMLSNGLNEFEIELNEKNSGVYYLELQNQNNCIRSKIMIK